MAVVNLKDVTFTIPTRIDSADRQNNLIIVIDYLLSKFDTNIIVCEEDSESKCETFWKDEWRDSCQHIFIKNNELIFHKTKNLNIMAIESKTPIIASLDSDVLFTTKQYILARDKIIYGERDFVYPFNRPTIDIPKKYHQKVIENKSVLGFENYINPQINRIAPGGCFFMSREKFFEYGMENEYFIGWGPEDKERAVRFEKLGGRIGNVMGFLYHLQHGRTPSSSTQHQFTKKNYTEYNKIFQMSKEDLQKYINAWPWSHKTRK